MSLQEKYARVILESCLKVEKGQPLFISYNVERSDFVRTLTEIAYELGVKDIYYEMHDPYIKHEALKNLEVEELKKFSFLKKENRDYLRIKLASIVDLDVDKMGRVQIPTAILAKHHINKDVVVLGAGDHIEIWDKEQYEQYLASIEDNFEDIAERIGNNDD